MNKLQFRSNKQRVKELMVILSINLLLLVISILLTSASFQSVYVIDISTQNTISRIIYLVFSISYILTIIYFIRWFRRSYWNLHQINSNQLSYSESAAAWSWFVPIISLFYPYKIMKEIWYKTQEYSANKLNIKYDNGLLIGWWMTWVISSIIKNISKINPSIGIYVIYISTTLKLISGILLLLILSKVTIFEDNLTAESEIDQIGKE